MEAMESPPSYEEAVNQELFRFQLPLSAAHRQRSTSLTEIILSNERNHQTSTLPEDRNPSVPATKSQRDSVQNLPSTSQGATVSSRKRSSTAGNSGLPHLSTINEEDSEKDDRPVTVVIDCIGIQASRLLENCDTSVSLANGTELGAQSKC